MITFIKRIVVMLFVTAVPALAGLGCNTAHGFGKDVEKVGDKIRTAPSNRCASSNPAWRAGIFPPWQWSGHETATKQLKANS